MTTILNLCDNDILFNHQLQEKEVYSQRQMLLSEIESIRQREAEVKREAEVNKRYGMLTIYLIVQNIFLSFAVLSCCLNDM